MVQTLLGRLGAAIFVLFVATTTASAQNYDGQGLLRFGIFSGGTFMNMDTRNPSYPGELQGGVYGITAGYDYHVGRGLVLGVETDLSVADASGDINGTYSISQQYHASLRGRIGMFARSDILLYGTAGLSVTGIEFKDLQPGPTGPLDANKDLIGWAYGGGIEYDMGTRFGMIAFFEYLHTTGSWDNVPNLGFDIDADANVFRLGFKFKVGHDHRWGENYAAQHEPLK